MSKLQALKAASNLKDVALLLGFRLPSLSYVLYKQPAAKKYKCFDIAKRRGGTRTINAPVGGLKVAQKKLSVLLQDCADEINASKGRKDRIAHGFKRKRSIVSNASEHRSRRYVFNIDLKDFFPAINFGRVRGYFISDMNFSLNERVATILAQIACYQNALPQGSPCSPVISNLVGHVLDMHLVRLASSEGCTYSRYADDLTFSTNKPNFPKKIALRAGINPHEWSVGPELARIVRHGGFEINAVKTRMQYQHSRQDVTGLVVNKKINVRSEYRHAVRAMVHSVLTKGSFEHLVPVPDGCGAITIKKSAGTMNQLQGMLGFIDRIDLFNRVANSCSSIEARAPQPDSAGSPLSARERTYRQFLLYREFYATERPVVICEGETDNVYLIHAIRNLAPAFPELAQISTDGKITIKIRLYKHSGSRTARIVDLGDGGGASLTKFIGTYRKEATRFKAPGQKHPVIVLYDNDSGAKGINGIIKQLVPVMPQHAPFVHIVRNLYAMPTPLIAGAKESKIEDFFDSAVKAIQVDGKTFSDGGPFDTATNFGKVVFAHKIIRPMADTLNFNGFIPLLTNIVAVLNSHSVALGLSAAMSGPAPKPECDRHRS